MEWNSRGARTAAAAAAARVLVLNKFIPTRRHQNTNKKPAK
jgi:hypothetical protein